MGRNKCGCDDAMLSKIATIQKRQLDALEYELEQFAEAQVGNRISLKQVEFHRTPHGGRFVSGIDESTLSDQSRERVVYLTGSVAGVPFKLVGTYETPRNSSFSEVTVAVVMVAPIPFAHRWTYSRADGELALTKSEPILDPNDPDNDPNSERSKRLDWWCIAKCGGAAIAACVIKCLPAAWDPAITYPACVTACAGAGLAGVAVCIATKCINYMPDDEDEVDED